MIEVNRIIHGDVFEKLKELPNECIDVIITSPPYYCCRDYNVDNQLGLEDTPQLYINKIVEFMRECKRVIKSTGSIILNLGDSFYTKSGSGQGSNYYEMHLEMSNGRDILKKAHTETRGKYKTNWLQSKQKLLIPYRIAIACQDELGLILRNDLVWVKSLVNWKTKGSFGAVMPCNIKDRLNTSHESIFFFVKNQRYFFDLDAIRVPSVTGNRVFKIGTKSYEKLMRQEFGHGKRSEEEGQDIVLQNNPYGKNPSDCILFPLEPNKETHYASFPTTLPDFFIKACCPEFVCSKCNKPREKIFNRKIPIMGIDVPVSNTTKIEIANNLSKNSCLRVKGGDNYVKWKQDNPDEFIGYSDCGCGEKFDSGIVLDPFCGTGTTLVVAKRLGRNYIGIDLNSDYCKLAEDSIKSDREAFTMSVLKEVRSGKQKTLENSGTI